MSNYRSAEMSLRISSLVSLWNRVLTSCLVIRHISSVSLGTSCCENDWFLSSSLLDYRRKKKGTSPLG